MHISFTCKITHDIGSESAVGQVDVWARVTFKPRSEFSFPLFFVVKLFLVWLLSF